MKKLLILLLVFAGLRLPAQVVTSRVIAGANMMIYTPLGYDSTKAYNALIFYPGSGETGTNAALLLNRGPFLYLKTGTDIKANILVVAIQNVNPNPRPAEMTAYQAGLKAVYKIGKIVATGLSRGGQDWDWFMGNAENQFSQVSALVIFSGEGPVTDEAGIPGPWTPSLFVKYNVPYWFGIGTQDPFYSANQARYNQIKALAPSLAIWTEWPGVGHNDPVWSDGYNPFPATTNPVYATMKESIYQWAASITGAVAPPVVIIPAPPPVPTIYKSAAQSASFARSNCTCGSPTSVTYSVAAGKYTSTVSQAAADAQATADLAANGPAYANANGVCTPVAVLKLLVTINSDGTYTVTTAP